MMSPTAPSRTICLLLAGVLVIAPAALVLGIGWYWLIRWQALGETIEQHTDQLHRYQRVIQTLPALKAELAQVESNDRLKSFYFNASTPALAGAALQRRLQEIVQAAGGRLISTQLLPSSPSEAPAQVRIRTQLQGTVDVLLDVLLEIEQARPFLFVDQMSVRSTARRLRGPSSRRRRSATSAAEEGRLTVRLDVFGYALEAGQ